MKEPINLTAQQAKPFNKNIKMHGDASKIYKIKINPETSGDLDAYYVFPRQRKSADNAKMMPFKFSLK